MEDVKATGASIQYNAAWNNANTQIVGNVTPSGNYIANSITFNINSIPYSVISSSAAATGYETSNQPIQFVINITKAATTANMLFYQNGILQQSQAQAVLPLPNTWNFYQNIPLLPSNNILYAYNGAISFTTPNSVITVNPVNTLSQSEYENYFPSANIITPYQSSLTVASPNSILGDNITINTNIAQATVLNAATVAGNVRIGNTAISETVTSLYNFKAIASSFVPYNYGLANPTTGSPVTITVNSIVQLFSLTNNVFRNASITFSSYNETLATCSAYPTNAINWLFYNSLQTSQACL